MKAKQKVYQHPKKHILKSVAAARRHPLREPPELSKLLMRPWLEHLLNERSVRGLEWINKSKGLFRVTWKHYSLRDWTINDVDVFKKWAIHTGKYDANKEDPAKWKTNFRCALNSLADVRRLELKSESAQRGKEAYRLFQFMPAQSSHRKSKEKYAKRACCIANQSTVQMMHSYSLMHQPDPRLDHVHHMKVDHEEVVNSDGMDNGSDSSDLNGYNHDVSSDDDSSEPNLKLDVSSSYGIYSGNEYVAINKHLFLNSLTTYADDELLLFPVEAMVEPVAVYKGTVL